MRQEESTGLERLRELDDRFHQLKKDIRIALVDTLNERYGGKIVIDDNEFKWMFDRGMDIISLKEMDDRKVEWIIFIGLMIENDSPCILDEKGNGWFIYEAEDLHQAMEFIFNHENYLAYNKKNGGLRHDDYND